MATAIAPRNDIYLSVLAGRAITALADLASDRAVWSERIEKDLKSGIAYCVALRSRAGRVLRDSGSDGWNALKRSVQSNASTNSSSSDDTDQSERVERFLSELVASKRVPEVA